MRLEIHRKRYGVDRDGDWWEKTEAGWIEIPKPEWAKKQKQEKVVDLTMQPPAEYKSKKHEIKTVKVFRIIEKEVPDYEAEVLIRNGWQRSETLEEVFQQLSLEDALQNSP